MDERQAKLLIAPNIFIWHGPAMMIDNDPILGTIETFLDVSGMSPSRFARDALNDAAFMVELRRGREVKRETRRRVIAFIGEYTLNHMALSDRLRLFWADLDAAE